MAPHGQESLEEPGTSEITEALLENLCFVANPLFCGPKPLSLGLAGRGKERQEGFPPLPQIALTQRRNDGPEYFPICLYHLPAS